MCFFFKQKTAYEKRISDWSSDVCSSDLAVERLESYTPAWPLPKMFRLTKSGKLTEGIFKGETINTPSMLAVEDAIFALEWGKSVGGLHGLIKRSDANADALDKIVAARPWLGHLAVDRGIRSEEHTSELQSLLRSSYAVFCL